MKLKYCFTPAAICCSTNLLSAGSLDSQRESSWFELVRPAGPFCMESSCSFSECCGFLWTHAGPIYCRLQIAHVGVNVFVSVRQPCGRPAASPGWNPPLAQCQLRVAPALRFGLSHQLVCSLFFANYYSPCHLLWATELKTHHGHHGQIAEHSWISITTQWALVQNKSSYLLLSAGRPWASVVGSWHKKIKH